MIKKSDENKNQETKNVSEKDLLDLRNDVVFKFYFTRVANKHILINFLNAVINPVSPIQDITWMNPHLGKELLSHKSSILDLALKLENGSFVDVEMQMDSTYQRYRGRILYYWAKLHQSQLTSGDDYLSLRPTISISILNYVEFPEIQDRFHFVFKVQEAKAKIIYNEDLQLHFLELPKYDKLKNENKNEHDMTPLQLWASLFQFHNASPNEIKALEQEATMSQALKALKELSQEPTVRELAEAREKARINEIITLGSARDLGLEEGLQKGMEKGIEKGIEKGREAQSIDVAKKLLNENVDEAFVERISGLSLEKIREIKKSI